MEFSLLHYLTLWHSLGYVIVFVGIILEGDAVLFTASFLVHEGFFDFGDTLFVVLSAAIIGDLLWYWLGVWVNNKTFFLSRWVKKIAKPFDSHISKRLFHTIFLSKFAYGFHHAVLMRSGMLGVPFNKFIKIVLAVTLVWVIIIGGLGYLSGASLSLLKHYFRFVEFTLLAALILFFIIGYFFKNVLVKKL